MLENKNLLNLKKYSLRESNLLLEIGEDDKGRFYIRPIRWSGSYANGKLLDGECLAVFDTKEQAEDALINICGYSKELAKKLTR